MASIIEKVEQMSDDDLKVAWEALRHYNPREMYDASRGVTMDDWAQLVYSEISRRRIPW